MKARRVTATPAQVRRSLPKLSLLALSMLPAMGYAQSSEQLGEMTVIGTRSEVSVFDNPRSVSVVDQDQLKRQAPQSIGDVLRDVPGIELVDSSVPGMKRLRIRGESSRRVTVLVDGQEITDHSSYGTPILVNPAAVERIDVVRGPASVLYGAKAIGGVVNIITKTGAVGKAAELEIGATYYSATEGFQGWTSFGGTKENFDYRVTLGKSDHDDQHTPVGEFTSTGRLDTSSYDQDDITAHAGVKVGESGNHYLALKLQQYRLDSESWRDPSNITGSAPFTAGVTDFTIDLPQRDLKKIGFYYTGTDLSKTVKKVQADAYYQTVERLFENNVESYSPPPPFPMTTSVNSTSDDTLTNYGANAQIDLELSPHHYTILGAEYLADSLRTDKSSTVNLSFGPPRPIVSSSSQKARIDTLSLFAHDTWSFQEDWKLFLGLRFNHFKTELEEVVSTSTTNEPGSSSDNRISSSAAVAYYGIPDTTLRASYSSGYINPTLLQSYSRTSAGGETIFGNPDLDVETADNIEFGYRYDNGQLVLDAVAFYTEAEDYISTVTCGASGTSCPGASTTDRTYVNVDEATTYGVELLAEYRLADSGITPYISAAWTERELKFAEFSTKDTNVPELFGRIGARYDWEMSGANLWTDLFVRASTNVKETLPTDSGSETSEVDSWATLNLAFGGSFGQDDRYRFVVQANNITDQEYRPLLDALPGADRSLELTMALKF